MGNYSKAESQHQPEYTHILHVVLFLSGLHNQGQILANSVRTVQILSIKK